MRAKDIPGKKGDQESSRVSPEVIQMNSSDPVFLTEVPAYYGKLLKTFSFHTTRISPVLPLDKAKNRFIKRGIDLIISLFILFFILSWLIPLLAALIKIDSKGPVFFVQKRNGRNGKVFMCIKFRTMVVNKDADVLPACNEDKRITRLGRFLRNNYLDELPQFLNVFWGQMSVSGPRPHMISDNRKYESLIDHYRFRERVKPGITGLAQILGYTGCTEDIKKMTARIQLDILYIRHWSFITEIRILFATLRKITGLASIA